jgi:hypothetical protein
VADLPGFELDGERYVRPDFGGRGLANVAPTVLRLLAPAAVDGRLPVLDRSVLPERLTDGIKRVVLVVADGLGHNQLLREIEAGNAPNLAASIARAGDGDERISYQPLTSVFPTTTVAALGSVNSGVRPTEHGLLGYTLYLPEFSMVAEMIRWGPLNRRVSFTDAEFGQAPEHFLWAETIYTRLQTGGVARTFAVNPIGFSGTALTRMLHQGATYRGYVATSSLQPMVTRLLMEDLDSPTYVYAYWPTVDTISHVVGPLTSEHSAEVAAFDTNFARLVQRLPGDGRTLLMLTADHGHIDTEPTEQVSLADHPELLGMLRATPAGERRAVYLYPRDGAAQEVVAYALDRLRDVAVPATRDEATQFGLFGPGGLSERAAGRIGDVLLFPRRNLQISAPIEPPEGAPPLPPAPVFRGLHGGLTEDEALVPLLAIRA